MEIDDIVSVWAGKANSLAVAEERLHYQYTEDGEAIDSWFANSFMIDHYDEDFSELLFPDLGINTIKELLQEASYAENNYVNDIEHAIQQKNIKSVNLIYMLFNFMYEGDVQEAKSEGIYLVYIGRFRYR
jgi:hypothetical protein